MEPVIALNGRRGFSKLPFQNTKEGLLKINVHDEGILIYLQHSTAGQDLESVDQHPWNTEEWPSLISSFVA